MAVQQQHTTSFASLPPEIILEIIPRIPYDPESLLRLQLTLRSFRSLIESHEHSMVSEIRAQQYTKSTLRLFPSLAHDWRGLSVLHRRLQTLADVHEHWLKITHNGPELHWLRDRWEAAHKAGMLLLYRIRDNETHEAKMSTVRALPATSLACLLFKLYSSIKILRIYGPEPINLSFAAGDLVLRSDIELAFEEMLLTHGPDFFVILLKSGRPDCEQRGWAIDVLRKEVAGMEDRQLPLPDGTHQPPTLISVLRQAFAACTDCHVAEVTAKMWEILSGTLFDSIDEDMMASLVNGEAICRKGRMERQNTWHMTEGRCCGY
ncbi:hypothetical protein AMS68_001611 [Peltaster fructicola]|uniref:F-box domain-containing protein n=1 Tax=Peltaster fructicola TaxID=286661 RepID=A0A6H0XMY7_9PEZI|nr:hypothetical protein AMS68_001611 [Peltaster fructicola]